MVSLDAYYRHEHDRSPVVLRTDDDIEAFIARIESDSTADAPPIAELYVTGDPYSQGLDIGIAGDRGVVRYSGADAPLGLVSHDADAADTDTGAAEVAYFFMGNWRGFPADAEVPLSVVIHAAKEFLALGGARPNSVRWQAAPEARAV